MKKALFSLIAVLTFTVIFAQDKPEGLFINSKAYDFKAKDQSGNEVSLKELRKKGYVVVLFSRGSWCPYCNRQLQKLQDSLSLITAKGASVVVITPELPEGINKTVEKTGAAFPIIYDEEMKFAKAYQVAFKVDDRTVQRYKNTDIDLLKINGQREAYLPVPAIYVINKDGSVVYRYFNTDYKKQPTIAEILAQIK
jgi:peroxiredoxin